MDLHGRCRCGPADRHRAHAGGGRPGHGRQRQGYAAERPRDGRQGASIPVELSTKLPIISFAEADYKFAFGEQRDIPCTVTNVATCDITALKGWDIALDIENSVLKVTAPADGADSPVRAR